MYQITVRININEDIRFQGFNHDCKVEEEKEMNCIQDSVGGRIKAVFVSYSVGGYNFAVWVGPDLLCYAITISIEKHNSAEFAQARFSSRRERVTHYLPCIIAYMKIKPCQTCIVI